MVLRVDICKIRCVMLILLFYTYNHNQGTFNLLRFINAEENNTKRDQSVKIPCSRI